MLRVSEWLDHGFIPLGMATSSPLRFNFESFIFHWVWQWPPQCVHVATSFNWVSKSYYAHRDTAKHTTYSSSSHFVDVWVRLHGCCPLLCYAVLYVWNANTEHTLSLPSEFFHDTFHVKIFPHLSCWAKSGRSMGVSSLDVSQFPTFFSQILSKQLQHPQHQNPQHSIPILIYRTTTNL